MNKTQSTVEILLQIREDLKGLTATNAGLQAMRGNMAAASAAAKQQTASIDRDFGKLSESIKKKFSAKDVGMSLLGGLGIGSAFGIINTVVSQATSAIEAHRQSLLLLDTTWKGIVETSRAYQFDQLTPAGKSADLDRQIAEAQARYRELVKLQDYTFTTPNLSTGRMETVTLTRPDDSLANQQRIQENLALQQRLAIERAKLNEQITKDAAKSADEQAQIQKKAADTGIQEATRAAQEIIKREDWVAAARAAHDAALINEAEAVRAAIATPQEEHARRLVRLNTLYREGKLTIDEYNRAVAQSFKKLDGDGDKPKLIQDAAEEAKRAARAAEDMGWAFSSAFETAILDGKKFSEVLKGLIRDIAQIVLRRAVTDKLGSAVSGWASTIFAAGGGTFMTNGPTQLTVGDNPGGAELVSVLPISGVGTTRTSGSAVQMAGGGALLAGIGRGGGDTFQFSYSFGSGVSRGEILALLPDLVEASKRGVLDAQRRRRDGFR